MNIEILKILEREIPEYNWNKIEHLCKNKIFIVGDLTNKKFIIKKYNKDMYEYICEYNKLIEITKSEFLNIAPNIISVFALCDNSVIINNFNGCITDTESFLKYVTIKGLKKCKCTGKNHCINDITCNIPYDYFIIMEYIDGITLADYNFKAVDELIDIFKKVIDIYIILNEKIKIIHVDSHFENIIVTCENKIKLIDFGQSSKINKNRKICHVYDYLTDESILQFDKKQIYFSLLEKCEQFKYTNVKQICEQLNINTEEHIYIDLDDVIFVYSHYNQQKLDEFYKIINNWNSIFNLHIKCIQTTNLNIVN